MSEERYFRPIDDPSEIPENLSDEERTVFLEAHGVSEEFLDNAEEVPEEERPVPRSKPINVRFDDFTLRRLKELADGRAVGYQTLLKQFVTERLYEEERRSGVLPVGRAEVADTTEDANAETRVADKRDWQQKAFDYVNENTPLIEDEDLDFIVSSRVISDAASLLLEISNQISAATKRKAPAARLKRMMKGYNKLKEFCDRAFAIHEEKFGLPELTDEEPEEPEEPEEQGDYAHSPEDKGDPDGTGGKVTDIKVAMRRRDRAEGNVGQSRSGGQAM